MDDLHKKMLKIKIYKNKAQREEMGQRNHFRIVDFKKRCYCTEKTKKHPTCNPTTMPSIYMLLAALGFAEMKRHNFKA